MTHALWLVCDASGSMSEGGKRFIVRGLVQQVVQYFRLGYAEAVELRIAYWADSVSVSSWNSQDGTEPPLLICHGVSDGNSLGEFFGSHEGSRFLLISDGAWSGQCRRTVHSWMDRLGSDGLRVIKVGHDENRATKGPGVGVAEDMLRLFHGWFVP